MFWIIGLTFAYTLHCIGLDYKLTKQVVGRGEDVSTQKYIFSTREWSIKAKSVISRRKFWEISIRPLTYLEIISDFLIFCLMSELFESLVIHYRQVRFILRSTILKMITYVVLDETKVRNGLCLSFNEECQLWSFFGNLISLISCY